MSDTAMDSGLEMMLDGDEADDAQITAHLVGAEEGQHPNHVPPEYVPEPFRDPETGEIKTSLLLDSYEAAVNRQEQKGFASEAEETEARVRYEEAQQGAWIDAVSQVFNDFDQERLAAVGLSPQTLQYELATSGDISWETAGVLQEAGYAPELVANYLRGMLKQGADRATEQRERLSQVYDNVGGEAEYYRMVDWAKDNMTPTEKSTYNTLVNNEDFQVALQGVSYLAGRYKAQEGFDGDLVYGRAAGLRDGFPGYQSEAEMMRDMQDNRYDEDPAFRAMVEKRLSKSNLMMH